MNAYEFDPVVNIDKKRFTDTERNLILQVVARDEDIRRQERNRIRYIAIYKYKLKLSSFCLKLASYLTAKDISNLVNGRNQLEKIYSQLESYSYIRKKKKLLQHDIKVQ